MKQPAKKSLEHRNFQNYVSITYFFLLSIGILFDTIYFSFFEVNILHYSSVMDILLTPLDFLLELVSFIVQLSLFKFCMLVLLVLIPSVLTILGIGYANKKYWANRHKIKVNAENLKKITEGDKIRGKLFATTMIGLFIGIIFPALFTQLTSPADTLLPQMKKGELASDHKIVFIDNSEKNVHLIRERSQYIFYVVEKDTQITIAPILGTIKEIRRIAVLPKIEKKEAPKTTPN